MGRVRYFHEDEYCQQQILPLAAWDYCASEIGKIAAFAEANRSGAGFADIYVRGEPPTALRGLQMPASGVEAAVASRLPRFDEVCTGYAAHRDPRPGTLAFGLEDGFTLFLDVDRDGLVEAAWLDPRGAPAGEESWMPGLLAAIPMADRLLLVDWASGHLQRVDDPGAWARYLDAHAGAGSA